MAKEDERIAEKLRYVLEREFKTKKGRHYDAELSSIERISRKLKNGLADRSLEVYRESVKSIKLQRTASLVGPESDVEAEAEGCRQAVLKASEKPATEPRELPMCGLRLVNIYHISTMF